MSLSTKPDIYFRSFHSYDICHGIVIETTNQCKYSFSCALLSSYLLGLCGTRLKSLCLTDEYIAHKCCMNEWIIGNGLYDTYAVNKLQYDKIDLYMANSGRCCVVYFMVT